MVNLDYLYNPAAAKPHFAKDYFSDKKLGFQVIENGIVLPHKDDIVNGKWTWGKGGIVDGEGNFIKSSHVISNRGESYTPPPNSIQHSSETVIYLGLFFPVWGHVLTDNIRRVWFLKSEFMNQFKNCPIVYVNWVNYSLINQKDFRRLLEILEVDVEKLRPITQPTQFDKIILPDESFYLDGNRKFTAEYREAIDRVRDFALKNRTPTSSKKLYFFYGSRGVGEERLAQYLQSKGYETISPKQRADFDEELNLLINCESFASPLGSCAHNSLFLRDNTETIFILRAANEFGDYQQAIDHVHPCNANYIHSTMSIFNVNHDSFCFIISEQLKRFFGDEWNGYEDGDFKTFLDYVNSTVRRGRAINLNELRSCKSIFEDFMTQLKQHEDLIASYDMPKNWDKFESQLTYQTHVHMKGWRDGWKFENQLSNPLDQMLDVLAIKINFPGHKVYYAVYFNDAEGWSEEVTNGEMAGTVGVRKPIYGIKIRFDEAGQKEFDILYRVHKFDGNWTDWARNGETLYSYGIKLNAIQIKLEKHS